MPTSSMSPYDVFISHSPKDSYSASIIANALEGSGLRCGLRDTENPVADLSDLLSSISETGHILLLLSAAYSSRQPPSDWDLVCAFPSRRVIPIRLDSIDVAPIIGPRVCVDLHGVPPMHWIELLKEALFPEPHATSVTFPGRNFAIRRNLPAIRPRLGNRFVWNAPIRRTFGFFGRDELLQRLEQNVLPSASHPPVSVSVIVGGQGLGKSSLALEFAHRNRDQFAVVWWCRANNNASMLSDLRELARSLKLTRDSTDVLNAARAARSWCETVSDRWLLIFDNADDPDSVVPWIPVTGNGIALVTSRVNTWGSSSRYLAVDRLDTDTAIRLLHGRTSWEDNAATAKLVRQVGCLPIAIDLISVLATNGRLRLKEIQDIVENAISRALADSGVFEPEQVESIVLNSIIDACIDKAVSERQELYHLLPLLALLAEDELPVSLLRRGLEGAVSDDLVGILVKYGIARLADTSTLSMHPAMHSRIAAATRLRNGDALSKATAMVLDHIRKWPLCNQPGHLQDLLIFKASRLVKAAEAAGSRPANSIYLCDEVAQHHLNIGDLDGTVEWLSRALSLVYPDHAESVQTGDPELVPVSLKLRSQLASILAQTGKIPEAQEELAKTLGLQSARWDSRRDLESLIANNNLALALAEMGQSPLAQSLQEDLLSEYEKIYAPDDPNVLTLKNNLASSLWELGDLRQAEALYKGVLDARSRLFGESDPETLVCIVNLAAVVHEMGDLERAREYYDSAITSYRQSLGSDHPGVLACANNYAMLEADLGELGQASELYEDLVLRCRRVLGPEHPDTLAATNNFALVLARLGDVARAREFHEHVLRSRIKVLGDKHPDTLSSMANLCELLSTQGDLAGAYAIGKRVVRTYVTVLGERHPDSIIAMKNLAHIQYRLGKFDELHELREKISRASTLPGKA